jgi:hypothetical protein
VAPSPVIPTSFVPKQPVRASGQYKSTGGNPFLLVGFILFGISIAAALGVFLYEQYLTGVRDNKRAEVEQAEEAINSSAVEEFIRTRERFTSADELLNGHIAASKFFALLEGLTLESVRFNTLSFKLADDRTAEIQMTGVARTFNALAAQSSAFASETRIRRAIFSDIDVNDTGTVSFALSADLTPGLLKVSEEEALPYIQLPAEETTPSDLPLTEEATTTPETVTPTTP